MTGGQWDPGCSAKVKDSGSWEPEGSLDEISMKLMISNIYMHLEKETPSSCQSFLSSLTSPLAAFAPG